MWKIPIVGAVAETFPITTISKQLCRKIEMKGGKRAA